MKEILANEAYRGVIIEPVKFTFGYIIQVVLPSDNRKIEFKPIYTDGL